MQGVVKWILTKVLGLTGQKQTDIIKAYEESAVLLEVDNDDTVFAQNN